MNINLIETTKGYPYITRANLSKQLGVSVGTVDNRAKEIEAEVDNGRYPDCSVIHDGGITLFNYLDIYKKENAIEDLIKTFDERYGKKVIQFKNKSK